MEWFQVRKANFMTMRIVTIVICKLALALHEKRARLHCPVARVGEQDLYLVEKAKITVLLSKYEYSH